MENNLIKQKSPLSWSVLQRLRFIDFYLCWEGRINRGDLMETFGVSIPKASLDFREYMERAPGNMEYNRNQKFYFPSPSYKPVFIAPTAEVYFDQLSIKNNVLSNSDQHSIIRSSNSFDVLPSPERRVDFAVLRSIVQAINNKSAIEIKYQSISTDLPAWRWIEPHSFAFDGLRWHVRAYCHSRSEFRDFVIGRVLEIRGTRDAERTANEDAEWNEYVRVVIAANPGLGEGQQKIIERDYAMKDGKAEIIVRRALLFYMKRRLGVIENHINSPSMQHIVIVEIISVSDSSNK